MAKRSNSGAIKPTNTPNHWSKGLFVSMKDPKYIIQTDDLITVIKDMYPKAEFHYLILPNEKLNSLKSVNKNHVKLLQHMHDVAEELSKTIINKPTLIGYHAIPSMTQLHLHLISDDFNSTCLKNKKHWNSFTTGFFVQSKDVIKSLEKTGQVELPSKEKCEEFLKAPLKCHKCERLPKNIPLLKQHILTHLN